MNTATHDAVPARRLDRLLAHYAESHRHPTNELIHYLAIPAILLSILGLLAWIHPWAAWGVLAGAMLYYALLQSPVLFIGMLIWGVASMGVVQAMGDLKLPLSAAIFVVAWIFQFIGHKVEGKKPSFFEDIQYLLVGPLFVLTHLLQKLGMRW